MSLARIARKEKPRRSGVLDIAWRMLTTRCGRRGGPGPSNGMSAPREDEPQAGEQPRRHGWHGSRRKDRDGNRDRSRLRPESRPHRRSMRERQAWHWRRRSRQRKLRGMLLQTMSSWMCPSLGIKSRCVPVSASHWGWSCEPKMIRRQRAGEGTLFFRT